MLETLKRVCGEIKIFGKGIMVLTKVKVVRKKGRKGRGLYRKRGGARKGYTGSTIQTARPQRMLARLPYFTSGQLYNAVGLYQTQLMNLNSIYDPDRSGLGHQPLGHDEWATWYNRYRVFKVDYVITFNNLDESQAAIISVINQNGIPTYSNEAAFEQPGAYVKTIGPVSGMNRCQVKGSVYLPRLNGKTPGNYKANDDTQALFTANPSETLTQALVVAPVLPGSPVNIAYTIKYMYHLEMFDPNTLGMS